jgi:uncharacterized protein (DUF885 family)
MRRGLAFALLVLIALAIFLVPTLWFRPWIIDHFYMRVFLVEALHHPTLLTQIGVLDGTPLDGYNARLDDLSPAAERAGQARVERALATLRGYDRTSMSRHERLSADVLDWYLDDQKRGGAFPFHDYPVNQLAGVQSQLPDFLINLHPLKRERDVRYYVRRVAAIAPALDQVIEGLKLRESLGVVPPRFVLDKVLIGMKQFTGVPPRENELYRHLAEKLPSIRGVEAKRAATSLADVEAALSTRVYPAYARLAAECAHLDSIAGTDDGIWKLPQGDAYYSWCLRHYTTTDLSADSIHALGLAEVARIQAEMRSLLRAQHLPAEDVGASVAGLREQPRFHYPDVEGARDSILADYQRIIDDASRRSDTLFHMRPKAGVVVKRVPPFEEATAPGGYYQPASLGGDRPGTFFANLRDVGAVFRPSMRTLAYHEAIPGHHFQISIAQEMKDVPFFRKLIPFTAYLEGWGLYAEQLALEQGFHPTAYDSLGALGSELFRAARLVVDTGIHRKHWTREQAIEYMVKITGRDEAAVISEVERYIVAPGQACSYKVGELKILALRERARAKLGAKFDLRQFHDLVLRHGALPLSVLEREVDDWIDRDLHAPDRASRVLDD